jgi:hypothetical protein
VAHCNNGTIAMLYAPKQLNSIQLTGVPLINGVTYVYLQSYQYYPNGSYGIYYSTGLFQYVPHANESGFSMFQWHDKHHFSPNYGYSVQGGQGFFFNGANWT